MFFRPAQVAPPPREDSCHVCICSHLFSTAIARQDGQDRGGRSSEAGSTPQRQQFDRAGAFPASSAGLRGIQPRPDFMGELRAAFEDDDFVAFAATALKHHLAPAAPRQRGRPSLNRGEDLEDIAGAVGAAKLQVADHMDKCSVCLHFIVFSCSSCFLFGQFFASH